MIASEKVAGDELPHVFVGQTGMRPGDADKEQDRRAVIEVRVALHALKVEMRQIPRLRVETACIGIFERMPFDDEHLLRTISGVQAFVVLLANHSFGVPDAEARVCNAAVDAMDALLALADLRDGNPGSHLGSTVVSPEEMVRSLSQVQVRLREGRSVGIAVVELRNEAGMGQSSCFVRAPVQFMPLLKRAFRQHAESMAGEPSPSESGTG